MTPGTKKELVYTFRTTHDAIRAEQLLLAGAVPVRVMSLPASLGAGCGLCLRVEPDDKKTADGLLGAGTVCPQGVYEKSTASGKVVYAPCTG